MNESFLKIAQKDDNIDKIKEIIVEGKNLRNELINNARRILTDLESDNKAFKKQYVYQEPEEIWGIAVFEGCFTDGEKYNFTIDIGVCVSGYKISIFNRDKNNPFDDEFEVILEKIIPNLSEHYDLSDRAYYKESFSLQDYDKLLILLKEILYCFNKHIGVI